MNLKNKIKNVLLSERTKKIWRDDFNSTEYKQASELNKILFGIPLNQMKGCQCVDDLFALIKHKYNNEENINLKIKQMENKFRLKKDVLIMSHQLGDPISNNNLTDEMAIRILKLSRKNIDRFEVYPSNWAELLGDKPEKVIKSVPRVIVNGVKEETDWRELADALALENGIKKPHWNSSDEKLKDFIAANS